MCENNLCSIILLTGSPGVGKTTLVRKVCRELVETHKIVCDGFCTDEVRNTNMQRIGFDVMTLDETKSATFARSAVNIKGPYVGKYGVFVKDFEDLVLPLLKPANRPQLLVIDEIGKMELKSKRFETAVYSRLDAGTTILATIPYEMRQPLALVEKLKSLPNAKLIIVTKENRNRLQSEVVENILEIIATGNK